MPGSPAARGLAALCAVTLAGIHLAVLEDTYTYGAHYLGALFAALAIGLMAVAVTLLSGRSAKVEKPQRFAWVAGSVTVVLMFLGFLVRSTVGLPGYHPHDWPGLGIASLAVELVFLACAALAAFGGHGVAGTAYPVERYTAPEQIRARG